MDKINIWKPICKHFFIPKPCLCCIKSFSKYKKTHIVLEDTMGRMFYLWIFFIQTISFGLTATARDWNNLGFKRRLMRSPEEPHYRFLMPSRYQLIWINSKYFDWKVFRTSEGLNGNNFLSLFLPDEYKRSDFRCRIYKVVTAELRAVTMVSCILYLNNLDFYYSENRGHPLSRWDSSRMLDDALK